MKNNKILMLVHDNRIDRRVLDEARTLINNGWEVTVIAGPPPEPDYTWDEECYPDVKILRLPRNKEESINLPEEIKKHAFAKVDWSEIFPHFNSFIKLGLQQKADIVVAHDLPQLPAAVTLASVFKSYVVYDSHELYPQQFAFGKRKRDLYSEVEEYLINYVDQVITVSDSFSKFMSIKYRITPPEVILNAPAIESSTLPIKKTNYIKENLGLLETDKVLLYQGGVSLLDGDVRNLEKLLLAMEHVKNENIKLVFMGPKGFRFEDFIQIAKRKNLYNKKFFFHDAVPQDILLTYTTSADAGIIPYPHVDFNTYFCSPNKLFEFIVAGLPILANSSPELNSFIKGKNIGNTVEMTDIYSIANAIDNFFTNDLLAYQENVKRINQNHIWEVEGEKLTQIYKKMVQKKSKNINSDSISLLVIEHLIETGALKLAETECENLYKKTPNNIEIANYLSLIKYRNNEIIEADKIIRNSLKMEPYNEVLLDNLNLISEDFYKKQDSSKNRQYLSDYIFN